MRDFVPATYARDEKRLPLLGGSQQRRISRKLCSQMLATIRQ